MCDGWKAQNHRAKANTSSGQVERQSSNEASLKRLNSVSSNADVNAIPTVGKFVVAMYHCQWFIARVLEVDLEDEDAKLHVGISWS